MSRAAVDSLHPAALAAVIERGDHWRGPTRVAPGEPFHEWSHFLVLGGEADLLVNWSRMRPPEGAEACSLTVLVRGPDGAWDGDVERFAPCEARLPAGSVAADLGPSRLRFRRGAYDLRVVLRERPVEARLRLVPTSRPALTSSVSLRPGHAMWFAVPRLRAEGELRLGRRRIALSGAPAYHDRDWGRFAWGGDHAWEWSVVLPRDPAAPFSMVVQRISDGARHQTLSQGLLLWRHGRYCRTLHHRALALRSRGLVPAHGALRVPRVMDLVAPGRATDVPAVLEVEARDGEDVVEGELRVRDLAQIGVPNDRDLGTTVVTEARAEARFEGRVRGERLALEGDAILELNRRAA
jgi:hypothetical protein